MLHVTITTVERVVFDHAEVEKISLPTAEGIIAVLPGHIALMTPLGMGEVVVTLRAQTIPYVLFVDGGVLQVCDDKVELLANLAEHTSELDEAQIEEAKRSASRLLQEKPVDVDLIQVEASLRRELSRLKLVRKWHQ